MFDLAKQKHLFLMEALWTRFLPAILKLKEVVRGGKIGEVHIVQADFSIIRPFNPKHRLYNPELGGGALLDPGQSRDDRQQRRFDAPYDVYGYGPEAMEVMRCLKEGLIESPLMPWSLSLKMMDLMDSIRSQWGMTYPSE